MKTILKILVVEDSEDDALLVLHQIKKGGYDINSARVDTPEKMKAALKEKTWDIILSDYQMPHFSGLDALALYKESGIDIPFIVISRTIGEEVAVDTMKAGAHDYIMKNNLQRLLPAIERELRESKYRAERKLLEQKQKQAEIIMHLQSMALESAANGIVITDKEGTIIWVNPAFTELTGYMYEEIRGQNLRILKSGLHDRAFYENLWQTILNGKVWHNEMVNRRKDGILYTEEMTITPVQNHEGEITNFIAIKQNITERKRVEEEIQKLNQELEKRIAERTRELEITNADLLKLNNVKNQFFSIISHDLRSPIDSLRTFLGIYLSNSKIFTPEELDVFFYSIIHSIDHISNLFENLLNWSKSETNQITIHSSDFCLDEIINETLELFSMKIRNKNITIKTVINKETFVSADKNTIKFIVRNLLDNAIKFTHRNGSIIIEAIEDNDFLKVSFSDDGVGISEENISKLLENSNYFSTSGTDNEKGVGLGIKLCKEFIKLNRGGLTIESKLNVGSRFSFTIPIA